MASRTSMCGITGFWAPDLGASEGTAALDAMNTAVKHRGPDGADTWHHAAGGPAFGHRRLAIVDLSPTGQQPMRSASGRFVITFNGEVYNYRELRAQLDAERRAPAWRGSSDTEVMLAAIEAWGLTDAVQRFIGMFAFALWDDQARELHLVRDRVGVKPLYFAQPGGALCFGSELKSLRCFPGYGTSIDLGSLAGYLRANCVPGERTIFEGTARIGPGTIATFREPGGAPQLTRYWDPAQVALDGLRSPFRGSAEDAVEALDHLLRDAVRLRMVADVPLGAFLSGGIDSSSVVALMQAQSSRPVHTFSIENERPDFDEGPAARAVARYLNTHHTAFTVTAKDALDVIPLLPAMYDEPFADSSQIPTYLVSKLARRDVTVALSGDGGDELFGGYVRHVWGPRLWRVERRLPFPLRRSAAALITRLSPEGWNRAFERAGPFAPAMRIPGIRMHKLASVLAAASPTEMYETLSSHWLPGDSVLTREVRATDTGGPAAPAEVARQTAHYMMYRDLVGYLPDDILTKVDRASMAVSLEAREPLLDHRLIAFAWSLPLRFKVRGPTGKWVLRRVLDRYVPPALLSGPKMGFGVPLGAWLRGPLRPWAESLLSPAQLERDGYFDARVIGQRWREHLAGTRPWEYHLWDILMFQAWRASTGT